MDKKLKPCTIVPQDLYVQRDADRQIRNIISDMGRPGYVLVSRQMGKTNLLLNAKNTLQNEKDIFVYIDMSNAFSDARSCFNNIVDTAIEVNYSVFESVASLIYNRRDSSESIPPHKQHLSELRLLLSCVEGKLVVILDEIDALAKTDYSDLIFAQIRSIYFSRVNFKELEKLTYILSGVIEPIDIIKDPKISPFNIGQKIYLNDFNRGEFDKFLLNANLELSPSVVNRIFHWTNGNPRITWDLCSELESIAHDHEISPDLVDITVQDLYLRSFDRPPIDNIRELVAGDREIRNALIEIFYNKGNHISDRIKNKLYLAGIVNYSESTVEIKNEVLKRSLNYEWIKSIAKQDKEILELAIEFYKSEKYIEAIKLFEEFLSDSEFDEQERSLYNFYVGEAYYQIQNFEKSIDYLAKTNFDHEDSPTWYYRSLNVLGSSLYRIGRIPESLEKLKIIVESGRRDSEYARGLVNYGITLLKSSEREQQDEAISIFKKVVDDAALSSQKIPSEYVEYLRSIALNYLARTQTILGLQEEAKKNYRRAINGSIASHKIPIILALYAITESSTDRNSLLDEIIQVLDSDDSWQEGLFKVASNQFTIDELRFLFVTVLAERLHLLPRMMPYIRFLGSGLSGMLLFTLIINYLDSTTDLTTTISAIDNLVKSFEDEVVEFNSEVKYRILKFRANIANQKTEQYKYDDFFNFFSLYEPEQLDQSTFNLFAKQIYLYIEDSNLSKALRLINSISVFKTRTPKELVQNFLVIHNLELNLFNKINDRVRANQVAAMIVEMSAEIAINPNSQSLLSEKGLKSIIDNANTILSQNGQVRTKKAEKNYSRNDLVTVRYKDGKVYQLKYKRVERAIASGDCIIVG